LLGVFLVSVGMSVDVAKIVQQPVAIGLAVIALIAVKAVVVAVAGPLFGVRPPAAWRAGLLLGPGGEFAFVVLGLAVSLKVVGDRHADFALLVTAISMCLIPLLSRVDALLPSRDPAKGAGAAAAKDEAEAAGAAAALDEAPVIVAGFGRVGAMTGELLTAHKVPWIGVDQDLDRVRAARKEGLPVYLGDAARPEFLRACGIERARALVVTMDGGASVDDVVAAAHLERPDLPIVARARDAAQAAHLYGLGVREAVPETVEAGLQLGEALLVEAGVPMGLVIASIHEKRAAIRDGNLQSSSATTPSERLRALRDAHGG
jgi:CPA2 family monovalent cation:H+ antiporter-2